jgi:hypothetical protein
MFFLNINIVLDIDIVIEIEPPGREDLDRLRANPPPPGREGGEIEIERTLPRAGGGGR